MRCKRQGHGYYLFLDGCLNLPQKKKSGGNLQEGQAVDWAVGSHGCTRPDAKWRAKHNEGYEQ